MDSGLVEKEIVIPLINITRSRESLYRKLCNLDQKGLKNSKEYSKLLEYLQIEQEVEDEYYNMLLSKSELCNNAINIVCKQMPRKILPDYDSIVLSKYDFAVNRRVINSLNHLIRNSADSYKIISFLSNEMNSALEENYYFFNLVIDNLEKDLVNSFLLFLIDAINDQANFPVKKQLIETMYYTSFIFGQSISSLIFSSNEETKIIPNYTQFLISSLNIPIEKYNKIKKSFLCKNGKQQIYKIISLFDENNSNINLIIRQCLLKAFLSMMDKQEQEELREFYNSLLNKRSENENIEEIVENCFEINQSVKNKQITIKMV